MSWVGFALRCSDTPRTVGPSRLKRCGAINKTECRSLRFPRERNIERCRRRGSLRSCSWAPAVYSTHHEIAIATGHDPALSSSRAHGTNVGPIDSWPGVVGRRVGAVAPCH